MYTFDYYYENENTKADSQAVTHTVHAEANLDELMQALLYFVQASGFTYVTHLTATKDGGGETTVN